jgi:hypothetical protein
MMSLEKRLVKIRSTPLLVAIIAIGSVDTVQAQLQSFAPRTSTGSPQRSYSDYYMESVQNFRRPPVNVRDYTIDKYYYRNPNLSPYLNLTRWPTGNSINNYYRYVLPEVERRAAQPPRPGTSAGSSPVPAYPMTGPIHTPVPMPSPMDFQNNLPYFNNYYGKFGGVKK